MKAQDFIWTGSRFVHMVGDCVAVCTNWKQVKKTIVVDGVEYSTRVNIPVINDCYIDFVVLRQERGDGEWYEDDDSPVEGGLQVVHAMHVADELYKAIEYIKGGVE